MGNVDDRIELEKEIAEADIPEEVLEAGLSVMLGYAELMRRAKLIAALTC